MSRPDMDPQAQTWADSVSLIPLKPREKKPAIGWTEYQTRKATREERAEWSSRFPGCNWGLVCGRVSNIVALDFDGEAGKALFAEHNLTGKQPTNLTGKGYHGLFLPPSMPLKNGVRIVDGLDIRSDGGYIVIPPSIHPSGSKYAWQIAPWVLSPPPIPDWVTPLLNKRENVTPPIGGSIPESKRNTTLASLAGTMRRRGFTPHAIEVALQAENESKCRPPLSEDEVRTIAASIAKYEPANVEGLETASPLTVEGLENFRPTDVGNARQFDESHGDKVRFCERLGGWHIYDGQRWKRDSCGEVQRLAKQTVREMYEKAASEPDDTRRIALARHAARSESAGKLADMLEVAKTEKGIAVSPEAFDAQPWLFNVANGTLDLITGELLPHRPEDMLTNISPAEWRGIDAKAKRFGQLLYEAMDRDQAKINFLQRAAGYTLSGDMREQVFLFLHGPEAAGKGTFVRAMSDVVGTYARSTEIGTFLTARRDAVRNDIASLVGSRLVTASEPEDGQVFDEGLIKILTGQDKTTARFLFREAFEFAATFKLWLQGNHRPHIKSTGGAMWRRLLIVPFTKTVPEDRRDKTLGDKLRTPEEQAGILAWMVRGCLEWQRGGLRPPDSVRAAVAEYRAAEDRLTPFLEECTVANVQSEVATGPLFLSYKAWSESNGERVMSKRGLGMRLEEKGFTSFKTTGGTRVWRGLRLVGGRTESGASGA